MKRLLLSVLFLSVFFAGGRAQYGPDCLGSDYVSRTFRMPADYAGEVVSTLVKKVPAAGSGRAVLYVHGYNDYFFQRDLADSIRRYGYDFYALDLRKYGRSLRAGQDTFFVKNLNEYYADIDSALSVVRQEGNRPVVLMGHSTGGLIASLYLHDRGAQAPVEALVLNSPFLDMNMNRLLETIGVPVVSFLGKYFPSMQVQGRGLSMYAVSLLKEYQGEWEYDTGWKLTWGHPIKAGWIRAVHLGQRRVRKGLDIKVPVLLMSSDRSVRPASEWNDAYAGADIVLDVNDIQRYGLTLGPRVTPVTVAGGLHDLSLSARPARDRFYAVLSDWLQKLPAGNR